MISNLVIERISPLGFRKLIDELVQIIEDRSDCGGPGGKSDMDVRTQMVLSQRLRIHCDEQIEFNDIFMGRKPQPKDAE